MLLAMSSYSNVSGWTYAPSTACAPSRTISATRKTTGMARTRAIVCAVVALDSGTHASANVPDSGPEPGGRGVWPAACSTAAAHSGAHTRVLHALGARSARGALGRARDAADL